MSVRTERCVEVEESIADVLEGLASAKLMEHIAECDLCRDFRYEAEQAVLAMESVGADFHPTEGFPDRMVGLVLEQRPDGPMPSMSQSSILPRSSGVTERAADPEPMRASVEAMVTAPTELGPVIDSSKTMISDAPDGVDVNATIIEAPKFIGAGAAATRLPDPPPPTETGDASIVDLRSSQRVAKAPSEIADPFVPTHKTVPLSAVMRDASGSIVPATAPSPTHDSALRAHDSAVPAIVEATTGRNNTGPRGSVQDTSPPIARAAQPISRLEPAMKTVPERRAAVAGNDGGNVRSLFRRKGFIAALVGGMAAAAAIGAFVVNKSEKTENQVASLEGAWGGTVASVSRASADGGSGFEVCKDTCQPAVAGAVIEAGSTLKTDGKTRARVKLADETWIALDRDTEVTLPAGKTRQAKIGKGMVVADVKKVDGVEPAKLILPQGEVSVTGTKVAATVTERRAAIEIVRGDAEVTSKAGVTSKLRAGEEATISGDGEPIIAAKATMSDALEWSSESADDVDAPALKGLGELRARKPGSKDEKVGAVKLTKHSVKVRVVDVIARTEIDETFTNQTDEELEGIFRFPLPPGAQIENLALEVDGKMIDGAFVDRDKGAAIWRGVIQNAAPKTPRPREEIIWVAGPWRDPALLEWQRGGRFELRIFPIPKKGARRVKLTYTEPVNQSAGVRRFTYPLAHDASGSTKIDDFNIDLQVLGNDSEFGVETRGYKLAKADGAAGAERFQLNEKNFVPAGDLTVEYALPDRTSALSWWAYEMPASTQQASAQTVNGPPAVANKIPALASAGQNAAQKAKDAALEAKALVDSDSPYVALAVRPKLPRFPEGKDRLHVVVVDSSRSMVGERFARATRLAAGIVREMDRRDQFMVLACDITCQAMGATDGRTLPLPSEPSAEAAGQVESFLGSIEPDGGSNVLAAVKAARAAAGSSGRELRVIYLGDGTPTVGPTKSASLESAVRHELPTGQGSVIAVALGSDADTTSLAAMARGGSGVLVPYVPGQRVNAASVDVLAAAYGSILSDVEVVLPAGLTEVTPKRLDPIPAGGEAFILARMTGGKQVSGDVILRGKVGNERFEKKWEAKVVSSTKAGNAFVPRLFAAAKIAELEQKGAVDDRERMVALSKQFNVASRHTSLIVLESEAMFKAFGLDKNGIPTAFTGEEGAERQSAAADEQSAEEKDAESEALSEEKSSSDKKRKEAPRDLGFDGDDGLTGRGKGGGGFAAPPPSPTASAQAGPPGQPAAESAPRAPAKAAKPQLNKNDPFSADWDQNQSRRPPARQANLVPMRRVFDRKASFSVDNQLVNEVAATLADAESASKAAPDSRDKTVALYKALMSSGKVGEALELTAKWSQRDALDPEALQARADLAAMNGDREKAMRILSGLADVRPGDKLVQKRLAAAFTQMGAPDFACQHRLALAEIDENDVNAVAAAVRCSQDQGLRDVSQTILTSVRSDLRDKIDTASRTLKLNDVPALLGDMRVSATWTAPVDLDIAIVDKSGKRMSWLGSTVQNVSVSAKDAASTSGETLAISGLGSGTFAVEVVRANGVNGSTPVQGELTFTLPGGETRKVPFTLTGNRVSAGSVKVFFTSRLVPANGFGGGGWRGQPVF
jgi:hypothetical protein